MVFFSQDGVKLSNYMFRPAFVAIVKLQSNVITRLYDMLKICLMTLDCNLTMPTKQVETCSCIA